LQCTNCYDKLFLHLVKSRQPILFSTRNFRLNMKNEHCPIISIITVVFNGAKTIEETILSVIHQTYKKIEYIIIDGGSTDGTLDVIKKYTPYIDHLVSEPDSGIYNAMNKGLKLAKGSLLILLNADDSLVANSSIAYLANNFSGNTEILVSDTLFQKNEMVKTIKASNSRSLYLRIPFMHTSCFVSRNVYEQIGFFNEKYRIAADVDFLMRAFKAKIIIRFLDQPVICMKAGGISDKQFVAGRKEYRKIYQEHYHKKIIAWVGYFYSLFDCFFLSKLAALKKAL